MTTIPVQLKFSVDSRSFFASIDKQLNKYEYFVIFSWLLEYETFLYCFFLHNINIRSRIFLFFFIFLFMKEWKNERKKCWIQSTVSLWFLKILVLNLYWTFWHQFNLKVYTYQRWFQYIVKHTHTHTYLWW